MANMMTLIAYCKYLWIMHLSQFCLLSHRLLSKPHLPPLLDLPLCPLPLFAAVAHFWPPSTACGPRWCVFLYNEFAAANAPSDKLTNSIPGSARGMRWCLLSMEFAPSTQLIWDLSMTSTQQKQYQLMADTIHCDFFDFHYRLALIRAHRWVSCI